MPETDELSPDQREDFVAYLDDELSEAAAQEIEQALSRSPKTRREVDLLTRVWDMLDVLPRAAASDAFTERTLSSMKVEDVRRRSSGNAAWISRARLGATYLVAAASLVLAAVLGFVTTNRWIPKESDQLIRELPLIENSDVYAEVGDVEFLRELEQSGLFDAEQERE